MLDGPERPPEEGGGDRREGAEPTTANLLAPARADFEGVEAEIPAGGEGEGTTAEGRRERRVLALRVDDQDASAEGGVTVEIALHEGRFAAPDLAEDEEVGVGQDLAAVELEGVVHERAAQEVAADEYPAAGKRGAGDKGIGGAELRGGRFVGGEAHRLATAAADGQRATECLRLRAIETAQFEARQRAGLLHPTAGLLERLDTAPADRDVAGEAVGGVAFGKLALAPQHRLLLTAAPRRERKAMPATELLVGDHGGARPLHLAGGPVRGDRGHHERDRPPFTAHGEQRQQEVAPHLVARPLGDPVTRVKLLSVRRLDQFSSRSTGQGHRTSPRTGASSKPRRTRRATRRRN